MWYVDEVFFAPARFFLRFVRPRINCPHRMLPAHGLELLHPPNNGLQASFVAAQMS
jgi:hypothetical protein